MADLRTRWLGLDLANPFVPSSSPLSRDLDAAKRLEDAGAAAIILHSLFEEQIEHEAAHADRFLTDQSLGFGEADDFHPTAHDFCSTEDAYLEHLARMKDALAIPVVASLNGVTPGGWTAHARALAEAGADALEANVYYLAADAHETPRDVENRYFDIVTLLSEQVGIPVAVKLSPQLTAPIDFVRRLENAGASGISLFNRFYQPDIDLDTLEVRPVLELSTPSEARLRVRWTAILRDHVTCSIGVTGGFHETDDAVRALLAGADVVHLCSVLLQRGPGALGELLSALDGWLDSHDYASVAQMKGSVSRAKAIDPAAFERANYLDVLDSYSRPGGVIG
jgi:dihydroorotate dehydrogenase (fumarate)